MLTQFSDAPRTRIRVATAISSALLLVAACSTATPPAATPGAPSSTQQTTATSQAPQPVTRSYLPRGYDLYWNGHTVYSNCMADTNDRDIDESGSLFDTKTGNNIGLPPLPVASGDEVVKKACTVTTNAAGKPRLIYLAIIKTPSRGLTPESEHTDLISFDPSQPSKPLATKPFPLAEEGSEWELLPATGTFVVNRNDSSGSPVAAAFFDPDTLELKSNSESTNDKQLVGLNYDGYASFFFDMAPNGSGYLSRDLHFFSGAAGTEVGVVRNVDRLAATNDGFMVEHNTKADGVDNPDDLRPGAFYFDMRTKDVTGPIAPYLATNENIASTPENADQYVYGDRILLMGNDTKAGKYIKVFDMKSKQEIFSLDGPQLEGLKVSDAFLSGDYVYLVNESDSPVVDIRNRQTVSSGWSMRPAYQLDDGWAWVVPGHAGDTHSPLADGLCVNNYGTSCGRGGPASEHGEYLARGTNGAYDGPWF